MNVSFLYRFFLNIGLILILSISLSLTSFAKAGDKLVEADAIIQLFPLRLTPLWWSQFAQANQKNLKQDIERLKRELNTINTSKEAQNLAGQAIVLLEQYETKRNTPLRLKTSVKNEEKRIYFLDDVFRLLNQKNNLDSDLELLNKNYNSLLDEIESTNNSLNKIKISYLKNDRVDADKLIQGLNWIIIQLNLSLLELTKKSVSARKTLLTETLFALKEENKSALDRLLIKEKEFKEAAISLDILKRKIVSAEKKLNLLKNNERAITITDEKTRKKKQLLSLDILKKSVELRHFKTEYLIQLLIININRLKMNPEETTHIEVKETLHKSVAHVKDMLKWMKNVGDRIEKEENFINSLKKLADNKRQEREAKKREDLLKYIYQQVVELEIKQDKLQLLNSITDEKLGKEVKAARLVEKVVRYSWGNIVKWMNDALFSISGTPVNPIGLLRFLFIIFVGWFISRIFQHTIRKVNNKTRGGMQESSLITLSRIASFFLIGLSLLIGFSSIGIDVTKLALVASALSVGIGFGLQNIINNFVSGIILLFERSMKVGDYIMLADGTRGEVREINIRSTVINTNDNIDVIVPNAEFVNSAVTNWTMNERFLRLKIPFSVAYGSDKELIRRIVVDAALLLPYTLNVLERQYPQVRLEGFGDSSLDFLLVVWIKAEWANRPGRVKAAYNWEIETTLAKNEVEIPFPQREVRLLGELSAKMASNP